MPYIVRSLECVQRLALAAGAGLGAILVAAPAQALTPLSGQIQIQAQSIHRTEDGPLVYDAVSDQRSWTGTPTLLGPMHVFESFDEHLIQTQISTHTAADWSADGLSGSYGFTYGWTVQQGPGTLAGVTLDSLAPNWSYTFVADRDGNFHMDYALKPLSETFGLVTYDILSNGQVVAALDGLGGGQVDVALTAGDTYTFAIANHDNLYRTAALGTYVGGVSSGFSFKITESAVPEPATWALMVSGFGLVGAALRRRKAATAT